MPKNSKNNKMALPCKERLFRVCIAEQAASGMKNNQISCEQNEFGTTALWHTRPLRKAGVALNCIVRTNRPFSYSKKNLNLTLFHCI